ncbi:hypothetical protein ABTW96_22130 [Nocardia beijingensis]|uniref:hypothetical protein n=1 Tax=Nocardia beijingensis TaxID=95162 RepID=UPI00332B792D
MNEGTAVLKLILGHPDPSARIAQATSSGIPAIAGFADGLLEDYDAVRNGLTLDHSSGAVEGRVLLAD